MIRHDHDDDDDDDGAGDGDGDDDDDDDDDDKTILMTRKLFGRFDKWTWRKMSMFSTGSSVSISADQGFG